MEHTYNSCSSVGKLRVLFVHLKFMNTKLIMMLHINNLLQFVKPSESSNGELLCKFLWKQIKHDKKNTVKYPNKLTSTKITEE